MKCLYGPNFMKKLSLKEIYLNELAVDEPEGGPFGKVLFAPQRADDVEEEPNTDKEEELFDRILAHYKGNSKALYPVQRTIDALNRKNKYNELLKPPPNTPVYRYMQNISIIQLSKIIGIPVKELIKKTGEIQVINLNNAVLKTGSSTIQSWTTDPYAAYDTFIEMFDDAIDYGEVAVLLESNTSTGGKFFMNPDFASKVIPVSEYEEEHEVISHGPVKIDAAAYYINYPTPEGVQQRKELEKNLKQIRKEIANFVVQFREEHVENINTYREIEDAAMRLRKELDLYDKKLAQKYKIPIPTIRSFMGKPGYRDLNDFIESGDPMKLGIGHVSQWRISRVFDEPVWFHELYKEFLKVML